jgi:predicted small secreted protein
MNRTMMRVLGLCLVLTAMFSFVGCNTVEGAGKDVENAGEAIEDAAD